MRIDRLGEERIVAWMQEFFGKKNALPIGIGDDAAVLSVGAQDIVLTSDILLQDTHIYKGMSPYQAGRKVATCNFSDLAAMGAEPKGFLLSIGVDPQQPAEVLKDYIRGAESVCAEVGAAYAGGDMTKSSQLILSGFALGTIKRGTQALRRTGARPGDILAVTGNIGSSACGWQILQNKGVKSLDKFTEEERGAIEKHILPATLEPRAKVKEGLALARSGLATSCIDISDGLGVSLKYLANGCGFLVDEEKIPVRPEVRTVCDRLGLDYEKTAYHVGEDFELLFTVRPEGWSRLKKQLPGIREIGRATESGIRIKREDGRIEPLETTGYDHFTPA